MATINQTLNTSSDEETRSHISSLIDAGLCTDSARNAALVRLCHLKEKEIETLQEIQRELQRIGDQIDPMHIYPLP